MNELAVSASRRRADRLAMIVGPPAVLAMLMWMAGWTGDPAVHNGLISLKVLGRHGPWAAAWIAAAVGLGWPLRLWLVPESRDGLAIQAVLGVAAMLTLDSALGRLGWLAMGGAARMLLIIGLAMLAAQVLRWWRSTPRSFSPPPMQIWAAAPAVAVLLLAATSAPGWLWASEFGGYDAMSYHLQLPKEWLALGRITPLEHNVYSFLPGFVEAAYFHLAILIGDGIEAAYACQLLHAALTLLTAAVIGRLAMRLTAGDRSHAPIGALAAVIMLGTPWVIVVGSLAYNEMATALMLAAGLLVIFEKTSSAARRGAVIGLLVGAACGAKLTAVGFVAAPLVILLALSAGRRGWIPALATASVVAVVCLSPWLFADWSVSGNPVFPFMTGVFGAGHWTAEQVAAWNSGHMPDTSLSERLMQMWRQLFSYGLGPNHDPAEPWQPQWSILPWLTIIGLFAAWRSRAHRSAAAALGVVLSVQLLFWILFTHVKSRFMLPAVVPGAVATAIGLHSVLIRIRGRIHENLVNGMLFIVALIWSSFPMLIFARERDGRPAAMVGLIDSLTGDALIERDRAELGLSSFPSIAVNHLLPHGARVLLVGDARPLYYRARIVYQTTWDRGPLSAAMRTSDDPAAWLSLLADQGFTHVLVDPAMLKRWENAGWNDPLLTADRVTVMLQTARLIARYDSGLALYELPAAKKR